MIIYAVAKAVYEDHENLVHVSEGQRAAIKRIEVQPLEANVHEIGFTVGPKTKDFIYLTNKTVVPAVVMIRCDGPLSKVHASIVDTKIMLARAPWQIPGDPKTWMFEIDSPPWTPTAPMLIMYEYAGATPPKCGFEAKESK